MSVKGELVKPSYPVESSDTPSGGESGWDGEEWSERGDHPLLNDLILETLFGFVRRFDLKKCRVVSKNWNLRSIPHMRAVFQVSVHGGESYKRSRRINRFVQLFASNQLGLPFESFKLKRFGTKAGVDQQFFQLCGETATNIDFGDEDEEEVVKIEHMSELLRSCPNLKVLGLPRILISSSGNTSRLFPDSVPTLSFLKKITFHYNKSERCASAIEELLTAASNISEIVVSDSDKRMRNDASRISAVLNCIEKLGMEASIQALRLHQARVAHIEQLQRMTEKGLKLKSLTLEGWIYTDIEAFDSAQIQLATLLRHTLQHFSVERRFRMSLLELPTIPNLKSLALRTFPRSHSGRLDLNQKFPAPETLELVLEGFSRKWENGLSKFESCQTLKAFTVDNSENNLTIGIRTFYNILQVFPNLTKLSLGVGRNDEEILRQIWTHMTGLKSLSIRSFIDGTEDLNNLELDSFFTGIAIQALKGLTRVGNELEGMTVEERRKMIQELQYEHCQLPSIRNLTSLTHLNVGDGGQCVKWEGHLTDVTAYLAFYSMNYLRHLDVAKCMFSPTCCEILTKETRLETWSFRNANGTDIIPPFLIH